MKAGEVNINFLAVMNMERADAASITGAVLEACASVGLTEDTLKHKLVGFCADKASVMQVFFCVIHNIFCMFILK